MDLVIFGALVLFCGLLFLLFARRHMRMLKAGKEVIGGDVCVACQSTSITEYFKDCFRCNDCDFTWGDGQRAYAAHQRSNHIASLSPAARHAFAIDQMTEADQHLLAAHAALQNASSQLGLDLIAGGGFGDGDMYSRIRNDSILQASAEMGLALANIVAAVEAARLPVQTPDTVGEVSGAVLFLDRNLGNMIADLAGHNQVEQLQQQAHGMQQTVSHALAYLHATPPAAPTAAPTAATA